MVNETDDQVKILWTALLRIQERFEMERENNLKNNDWVEGEIIFQKETKRDGEPMTKSSNYLPENRTGRVSPRTVQSTRGQNLPLITLNSNF